MIEIGNYRINRLDALNWTVETRSVHKKGKNEGVAYWKVRGYFPGLQQAALNLFNDMIFRSEASISEISTVESLIDAMETAKSDIVNAIKEKGCEND